MMGMNMGGGGGKMKKVKMTKTKAFKPGKVSSGKALSRKTTEASMPGKGMMEAANKVSSGTRLAKVFAAMVKKHAK